jgi:hypothetical protein
MNFMIYWQGIKYLKNIFMFHGECKYPMMMQVLHLYSITLFKSTFYHQCEELCNIFIYLNQYYIEHGINILKNILSFHGLRYYCNMMQIFTLFLSFNMTMYYVCKFQKICYRAQMIYGIA